MAQAGVASASPKEAVTLAGTGASLAPACALLGLSGAASLIFPVSYTHLANGALSADSAARAADGALNQALRAAQAPVSYTHLDVYKRQDWRLPARPSVTARPAPGRQGNERGDER